MRLVSVAILATTMLLAAGNASACTLIYPQPPPLPALRGEGDAAYAERLRLHIADFEAQQELKYQELERERQQSLWRDATSVALVEIVHTNDPSVVPPTSRPGLVYLAPPQRMVLRPVTWLQGAGSLGNFKLSVSDTWINCGVFLRIGAVGFGSDGDRFVMFFRPDRLDESEILDSIRREDITEPLIIEAMANAG